MSLLEDYSRFRPDMPKYLRGDKRRLELLKASIVTKENFDAIFDRDNYFDDDSEVYSRAINKIKESRQPNKVYEAKESGYQKWLIIGCVHVPFHDKVLFNKFLQYAKDFKPTGIILNGDFLDLLSLGSHGKDMVLPKDFDYYYELQEGYKALLQIEEAIGEQCKDKIFLYGNHEDRFLRYTSDLKNAKLGKALLSPEEGLRLNELGWEVKTNWKDHYVTLGNNLQVLHGIYWGEHAAAQHLKMNPSFDMIFNHTHRWQTFSNGFNTAYNMGMLGDIWGAGFKYADRFKKARWKNGFCEVYVNEDKEHFVNPIKCFKDGFFAGGKKY